MRKNQATLEKDLYDTLMAAKLPDVSQFSQTRISKAIVGTLGEMFAEKEPDPDTYDHQMMDVIEVYKVCSHVFEKMSEDESSEEERIMYHHASKICLKMESAFLKVYSKNKSLTS